MKHYVITIMDNPRSVEAADRCIASAARFGMMVDKFPAITPTNVDINKILQREKILREGFNEKYSRTENCIAAFLSHFTLWQRAAHKNQEITIFEHDAVVVDNIPDFIPYQGCINLGKPSYGRWNDPLFLGVNQLTSKNYFPGAHAYRIKPKAAKTIITEARIGAKPTDVFLDIRRFPFLEEYYPWPVEAHDSFTTIQNENGCQAKHNYGDGYEIV